MRLLRTFLSAGVAVAFVSLLVASGGDARTAGGTQTFFHFNMCGNVCSNGGLPVVQSLVQTIRARQPHAVTLNEVCENQYAALRAELRSYQVRFDPTGAWCRNGSRYGNAILVRSPSVNLVGSWPLPNPTGGEPRSLMCVSTRNTLTVCVTHISNEPGNIAAQVKAVATVISDLAVRLPLVLGGDLNTDPSDPGLDPLYATCYPSGAGRFNEADSAGCSREAGHQGNDAVNEATYSQRKLDYVFVSAGHWSAVHASLFDPAVGMSDHRALWVTATPALPGAVAAPA